MTALDTILAAPKITHDLVQGSPEWDQFRLVHRGASEAAAALGLSKKVQRNELLRMKHTGIAREFSDWVQKNILDNGHEVEALARPHVEAALGEDLYPVTCSRGMVSASCDGLTLDDRIALEHKQWNEELAALVREGIVPDEHMPQCQQILMVTGAEEVRFVVSDGTPEKMVWAVVRPDRAWWERIAAGWAQFDKDLASYVPPAEEPPKPTGRAPESLPALRIEITGAVTASNLAEFKANALAVFAGINRTLTTDAEFADAEKTVKWCGDVEDRLKAAKEHALSQTASIDALFKTIDDISAESRRVRLDLDKLVTARKAAIKLEIVQEGKAAYEAHEAALRAECGCWTVLTPPDFAGCIKGLRTVDSIRNAVQTTLANAKIKADESARTIRAALAALDEESKGHEHLFRDRLIFIHMIPEAVRLMVRDRIAKHQEAEQARAAELAEKERERIRAEEQAKAEREAREKIAAEQAEARRLEQNAAATAAMTNIAAARQADALPGPVLDALENAATSLIADLTIGRAANPPNVVPPGTRAPAANEPAPTIRLGQIGEKLGFVLTADFVAQLGFHPVATEKAAKLYRLADVDLIIEALMAHLRTVQARMKRAA